MTKSPKPSSKRSRRRLDMDSVASNQSDPVMNEQEIMIANLMNMPVDENDIKSPPTVKVSFKYF